MQFAYDLDSMWIRLEVYPWSEFTDPRIHFECPINSISMRLTRCTSSIYSYRECMPRVSELYFGAQGLYCHVYPYLCLECSRLFNSCWKCIHAENVSLNRIGTRIRIMKENSIDFQPFLDFQSHGTTRTRYLKSQCLASKHGAEGGDRSPAALPQKSKIRSKNLPGVSRV